jgi:hypothetical protein
MGDQLGLTTKQKRQSMLEKDTPLSEVSIGLKQYTDSPPPNRAIWVGIVDGRIPAKKVNGRWRCNLREVAEALGLVEKIDA